MENTTHQNPKSSGVSCTSYIVHVSWQFLYTCTVHNTWWFLTIYIARITWPVLYNYTTQITWPVLYNYTTQITWPVLYNTQITWPVLHIINQCSLNNKNTVSLLSSLKPVSCTAVHWNTQFGRSWSIIGLCLSEFSPVTRFFLCRRDWGVLDLMASWSSCWNILVTLVARHGGGWTFSTSSSSSMQLSSLDIISCTRTFFHRSVSEVLLNFIFINADVRSANF